MAHVTVHRVCSSGALAMPVGVVPLIVIHVLAAAWCAFLAWLHVYALAAWLIVGMSTLVLSRSADPFWRWPVMVVVWPIVIIEDYWT